MNNMYQIEGYWDVIPQIKNVSFPKRGKMQVLLEDGRIVIVSVSKFPSVKKLSMAQRKKWYILFIHFNNPNFIPIFELLPLIQELVLILFGNSHNLVNLFVSQFSIVRH